MSKIWAIARHMIAQGIRMRVAVVVMVLFVLLMPTLPFVLKGDGTLHGFVQVIITYSLTLATVLLSVLTLALSTGSLCTEIRDKQAFILDSKPIQRWQVLAGKWLGIMMIDASLLAFMGLSSYGFIRFFASRQGDLSDKKFKEEQDTLHNKVLCARRSCKLPVPDVDGMVRKRFKELKEKGKIPEGLSNEDALRQIRGAVLRQLKSVPFSGAKRWHFRDLPAKQTEWDRFTLRFKHYLGSEWAQGQVDGLWRFRAPGGARPVDVATRFSAGNFHEFDVPLSVVSPDGELTIEFRNLERRHQTVSFPLEDGLELLFHAGSFEVNFAQGLMVMLCKLGFLAAVGILCSTFLTLPVAVTLALCIYLLSGMSGFIADMVNSPGLFDSIMRSPQGEGGYVREIVRHVVRWYLYAVTVVLPPFEQFQVVGKLNAGREIGWKTLANGLFVLVLVRSGIIAALACFLYSRRELAGVKS